MKKNHEINNKKLINGNEQYLLVYPSSVEEEVNRSIDSLGLIDNAVNKDEKTLSQLEESYGEINKKLTDIDEKLEKIKTEYYESFNNIENTKKEIIAEEKVKSYMAKGNKYFYLSGWVPQSSIKKVENLENTFNNSMVEINDSDKVDGSPPKKMERNKMEKNHEINNKKLINGNEQYLLVYPSSVEEEVNRSIDSLGFIDNAINKDEKTLSQLEESYGEINKKLTDIDEKLEKIKTEYYESFNNIENTKKEIMAEEKVKSYMAKGNKYFYLSGWVPQSSIKKVENLENTFNNSMVEINDSDKVSESPPTKLKNNKLIKPFENIVNMYGTPNYNEIDPTSFLALTYILLYGMMFGDLGQGIIFILASFLLKKKWKMGSDLLLRTGVSASIFGLFYGSFFGLEDVIPTLVMKPFDNIMPVLAISIMFGIIIMLISYCLGIYNKLVKQKDLEEGIFGKEGLAGMLMMISFILLIAKIVILNKMPFILPVGMLIVSILMEIFKQPLSRTIENISPKYDTSASDYYLENSFSIIEAILSVFSNLVSFTRVGAFAINHVGLFMAFEVMASLVGGIGSFIILLLGNIIIIGLEGMVVFIQCLRLEYYELFSKYYKGDGEKFSPLKK